MPNWKKIALSGSSPEFSSLNVDNSVSAGSLTGSIDFNNLSNSPTLLSSSAQIASDISGSFIAASSSIAIDISSLQAASASHEASINSLESKTLLSSSAQIASDISGSFTSTSASIASDIASLVSDSGSFSTRVTAIEGFSSSIESSIYSYTGSFTGDGSGLTGVQTTIVEETTISATFTSATTASINHSFNTKNVIVSVYDENDDQFIPTRINTPDANTAVIYLDPATTGRAVVAKGGHLVSGSIYKELITGVTSSVINHNLSEEFPIVQLYESASREVFLPETIKSIDSDNTEITFSELIDCYVVIKR